MSKLLFLLLLSLWISPVLGLDFTWVLPTTNTDGTVLVNLQGTRLYCGPSGGPYALLADIPAPGTTHSTTPNGTYCVASAYNTTAVESAFSAQILVQPGSLPGQVQNVAVAMSAIASPGSLVINNTLPLRYKWKKLVIGLPGYIDRNYEYVTVPAAYLGLDVLQTANDDKRLTGPLISFNVNVPVTVYLVWNDQQTIDPSWSDTGDDIVLAGPRNRSVYRKIFGAGIVSIDGKGGNTGMYTVLVEEN